MGKPKEKQSSSALPQSLVFSESGVKFLASYHIWIVAAVWLGVRGYALWA